MQTMVAIFLFILLFVHAGCATVTRLSPGECVVLDSGDQVIVAGGGCTLDRVRR